MSKKPKDEAAEYFRRDAAKQRMSLKDYCDKYGIDYWELLGKKRPEVSIHQTQVT